MTREELEEKHRKEIQDHFNASAEAFKLMQERHDEVFDVLFDEGIDVPRRLRERMRLESDAFKKEWFDPGDKWVQLQEKQKKENEDFQKLQKYKLLLEELKQKEDLYKQTGREL